VVLNLRSIQELLGHKFVEATVPLVSLLDFKESRK
jgi:site-specific recombinase XerC